MDKIELRIRWTGLSSVQFAGVVRAEEQGAVARERVRCADGGDGGKKGVCGGGGRKGGRMGGERRWGSERAGAGRCRECVAQQTSFWAEQIDRWVWNMKLNGKGREINGPTVWVCEANNARLKLFTRCTKRVSWSWKTATGLFENGIKKLQLGTVILAASFMNNNHR